MFLNNFCPRDRYSLSLDRRSKERSPNVGKTFMRYPANSNDYYIYCSPPSKENVSHVLDHETTVQTTYFQGKTNKKEDNEVFLFLIHFLFRSLPAFSNENFDCSLKVFSFHFFKCSSSPRHFQFIFQNRSPGVDYKSL